MLHHPWFAAHALSLKPSCGSRLTWPAGGRVGALLVAWAMGLVAACLCPAVCWPGLGLARPASLLGGLTLLAGLAPVPTLRPLLLRELVELPPAWQAAGAADPAAPAGATPRRAADLDLSVSTDCEDLAAFAGDVFELGQQGRMLFLDTLGPELASLGVGAGLGLGLAALGVRLAKRR
jgi:hypothetical protein